MLTPSRIRGQASRRASPTGLHRQKCTASRRQRHRPRRAQGSTGVQAQPRPVATVQAARGLPRRHACVQCCLRKGKGKETSGRTRPLGLRGSAGPGGEGLPGDDLVTWAETHQNQPSEQTEVVSKAADSVRLEKEQ